MSDHSATTSPALWRGLLAASVLLAALLGPLVGGGAAQSEPADPADASVDAGPDADADASGVSDEVLILGAEVYTAVCSSCHQPGGTGIVGQFPPLAGNPNVADTDYMIEVITNGLQGEIVVNGETYNGRMPAFSTLPDDEVDAVIAYIQSGFQAPTNAVAAVVDTGPVAGTELPGLANMTNILAIAIAGGVAALVLAPRLTSEHSRLEMPWFDAWLKSGVIVIGLVVFTVFVPSWVLQTETVSGLDRMAQDIIGAGLWFGALAAGIWALWYANRERRI
ncbi:MAG: c-type cytochrome [Acidimicrobiales bacterium]